MDFQYDQKSEHFFNLAAFRFKENFDDVFIHCKLTVCRTDDAGSRCEKGCDAGKRRRRSTEEDMSAVVYVGPVKLKSRESRPGKQSDLSAAVKGTLSCLKYHIL